MPNQFPPRQQPIIAGAPPPPPLVYENQPIRLGGRICISEKILTSDKVLFDLYREITGFNANGQLPHVDFNLQKIRVLSSNVIQGKMLSHFGLYYVRLPMGGLLQIP